MAVRSLTWTTGPFWTNSGTADYLGWLQQAAATPGIFVEQDYGALIDRFRKGRVRLLCGWPVERRRAAPGSGRWPDRGPPPAGPTGPAQPWLGVDAIFVNPTVSATSNGEPSP